MTSRYEHQEPQREAFFNRQFHLTDGINAIVYRILNGRPPK